MNHKMQAHHEWATRPDDERFPDVITMIKALDARRQSCSERSRYLDALSVVADGTTIYLQTTAGRARFNNWSFGQLASLVGMPTSMLRSSFAQFPDKEEAARWVADGLNQALKGRAAIANQPKSDINKELKLLVQRGEENSLTLRSVTSTGYARIWDAEIAQSLLLPLTEYGFVNPPAMDGPAGLYSGDRDMFALMAPKGVARINMPYIVDHDGGFGGFEVRGLMFYPYLMLKNSEVGASSATLMGGLVQEICGNHILWGTTNEVTIQVRHTGNAALQRYRQGFWNYVRQWVTAGTMTERNTLEAAMELNIAKDKDKTLTILRGQGLTQAQAAAAVATVEKGNPKDGVRSQDVTNLFNLVAAITANAREIKHQDSKVELERKAGKLLQLAVL